MGDPARQIEQVKRVHALGSPCAHRNKKACRLSSAHLKREGDAFFPDCSQKMRPGYALMTSPKASKF